MYLKGSKLRQHGGFTGASQFSTLLSNEALRAYLVSLPEIRVFTADANAKKFFFNKVKKSLPPG